MRLRIVQNERLIFPKEIVALSFLISLKYCFSSFTNRSQGSCNNVFLLYFVSNFATLRRSLDYFEETATLTQY